MDGDGADQEDVTMCCYCTPGFENDPTAPPASTFDGSGSLSPDPFMIPHDQRDAEYFRNWANRHRGGAERQRGRNYGRYNG